MLPLGPMVFRRMRPEDLPAIEAHFLRLNEEDRHLRFGMTAMQDAALRRYCARIDWTRSLLVGCEVAGTLRGVGELEIIERDGARSAEVAFTVEHAWQGHGIGSRLFQRLITLASNRGIRRVALICFAQNRRMQRIARHYGAELKQYQSEVEGEIVPELPSGASFAKELLDEYLITWRRLVSAGRRAA